MGPSWEGVAVAARVVSALCLAAPGDALVCLLTDPEAEWPLDDPAARDALAHLAAAPRPTAQELIDDHFRLFVGPGRGRACPYESVYTSADGLLYGEDTRAVRAAYAELGVTPTPPEPVPDDHLGLELAYVAEVADRLAAAEDDGLRGRLAAFHAEHLDRFADDVLAQVGEHARTEIYRALPALTRSVLAAVRG